MLYLCCVLGKTCLRDLFTNAKKFLGYVAEFSLKAVMYELCCHVSMLPVFFSACMCIFYSIVNELQFLWGDSEHANFVI